MQRYGKNIVAHGYICCPPAASNFCGKLSGYRQVCPQAAVTFSLFPGATSNINLPTCDSPITKPLTAENQRLVATPTHRSLALSRSPETNGQSVRTRCWVLAWPAVTSKGRASLPRTFGRAPCHRPRETTALEPRSPLIPNATDGRRWHFFPIHSPMTRRFSVATCIMCSFRHSCRKHHTQLVLE